MKLRLWGTLTELAAATRGLEPGDRCTLTLTVRSVSGAAADRGKSALARVYVEAEAVTSGPAPAAPAPRVPPEEITGPLPRLPTNWRQL